MLKNNFIGFFTHVMLLIFSYGVGSGVPSDYRWVGYILYYMMMIIYIVVGMQLWVQSKKIKNFLSVSCISAIGLLIWLIAYLTKSKSIECILGFFLFPEIMLIVAWPLEVQQLFQTYKMLQLIFVAIPAILMWFGLELKRRRIRKSA